MLDLLQRLERELEERHGGLWTAADLEQTLATTASLRISHVRAGVLLEQTVHVHLMDTLLKHPETLTPALLARLHSYALAMTKLLTYYLMESDDEPDADDLRLLAGARLHDTRTEGPRRTDGAAGSGWPEGTDGSTGTEG